MILHHPVDRRGLQVLTAQECLTLLAGAPVGRVGFVAEGAPVILPVNHLVAGWTIVFRTAAGSKLATADMRRPMAFEVDGYDAATRTGWSVLARGVADVVWLPAEERSLRERDHTPWVDTGDDDRWVRLRPDTITGRRIVPEPDRP